jgi:hypothetical protein
MQQRRKQTVDVADAMDGLKALVAELNRTQGGGWAASAVELREIVRQWQDSGPNLWKLYGSNPVLWAETVSAFRPSLIPTKSGHANMRLLDNTGAPGVMESLGTPGIRLYAVVWFNALTLNPLWGKLAGPCARCGNYYIKKRELQKVYCSRRCGNAATAVARTRERIKSERKDKLLRAKTAIREWRSAKTQEDWKHWVAEHANVDPRFLTRAITKGDLVSPTKGR